MLTAEEKEQRRTCLGSSEIALIALGPTFAEESLWELWCSKTGKPVPERESNEMSLGTFLEPGIAAMFAHREKVPHLQKGMHWRHKENRWMSCTTDYQFPDPEKLLMVPLECKNYRWSPEWGADREPEAVPPHILIQVQWQMAVMQAERGIVAALVGGDFRVYPIPRSQPLIDRLIELGREFWENCVLASMAPEPDWTLKRTGVIWEALNPIRQAAVALPEEAEAHAAIYLDANESIKAAEVHKTTCRNRLLTYLGDAKKGTLPSGVTVARGKQFRVTKPKGNSNGDDNGD